MPVVVPNWLSKVVNKAVKDIRKHLPNDTLAICTYSDCEAPKKTEPNQTAQQQLSERKLIQGE